MVAAFLGRQRKQHEPHWHHPAWPPAFDLCMQVLWLWFFSVCGRVCLCCAQTALDPCRRDHEREEVADASLQRRFLLETAAAVGEHEPLHLHHPAQPLAFDP